MIPACLPLLTALLAATLVNGTSAQRTVASYGFANSSLSSNHTTPNRASDLTITKPFLFDMNREWLFLTTDWNSSGGSIHFTVTPDSGRAMSFTSLSWSAVTASPNLSDSVDGAQVLADGVEVARFTALQHNTRYSADLSAVAALRHATRPVRFEIRFEGNSSGQSSYAIDSIGVEAAQCVQNLPGDHRIVWLPINGARGSDRLFRALEGFSFREAPNGTAQLTGSIVNVNDPALRFAVDVTLSRRVEAGAHPPSGSPKIEPAIEPFLVQNGGTIDPATWRYYRSTEGTLRGRLRYEGAELRISRRGEAFQVGAAANLMTPDDGASGWFDVDVRRQPHAAGARIRCSSGDFNFELDPQCDAIVTTTATWSAYGTGIAGCDGVPSLELLDDPLLGSTPRVLTGVATSAPRMGAQLWSVIQDRLPLPAIGGDLLVGMPFAAVVPFVVLPGGTTFEVEILENPRQDGLDIFLQVLTVDPCGPVGIASTRGVQLTLGGL